MDSIFVFTTVQKAYLKIARRVHPDLVMDHDKEEFTDKFKLVQKVHAILSDPEKRRIYDETGSIEYVNGPRVFIVSDDQIALCREHYLGEKRRRLK